MENNFYDSISKTFTQKTFDWEKIRNNCGNFFACHSSNDPYAPLSKGKEIAEKLNAEPKIIKNEDISMKSPAIINLNYCWRTSKN